MRHAARPTMRAIYVLFLVMTASAAFAADDDETGIAEKYPNDKGIIKDRSVVFWDNFERQDFDRWDLVQHPKTTNLTRRKENVHSGKQAVEMTAIVPGAI